MNTTLYQFHLGATSTNPLVALPTTNLRKFFKLDKSSFCKQMSPMIFSQSVSTTTDAGRSTFEKFLTSAIHIRSDAYLIRKVYEVTTQVFDRDPVCVYDCVFRNFNLGDNRGAAFTTTYPVRMYNVLFENIKAHTGGCFFTNSHFKMAYVTIHDVEAQRSAGFESDGFETDICKIEQTSFCNCKSDLFPAFYRKGSSLLTLDSINFTNTFATGSVGCFESKGPGIILKTVSITRSEANYHNGACVFRESGLIELEDCIFDRCKHNSKDQCAAASILVMDPKGIFTIKNTIIQRSEFRESCDITIHGDISVLLTDCIFGSTESEAIRSRATPAWKGTGNVFGQRKNAIHTYVEGIGYLPNRPPTNAGTFTISGEIHTSTLLGVSILVGLVVQLVIRRYVERSQKLRHLSL